MSPPNPYQPTPIPPGAPVARPVPAGQVPSARPVPGQAMPYQMMPAQAVPAARPVGQPMPLPPGATPPRRANRKPEEGEEEENASPETKWLLSNAPPWLISTVIHVFVLIILGLWYFVQPRATPLISLDAEWHEFEGEQLEDEKFEVKVEQPEDASESAISDKPAVTDPFAAPEMMEVVAVDGTTAVSDIAAPTIGMALDGREEGLKQALLGKYGGNPNSERAVQNALEWLARNQNPHTGGWELAGKFADGATYENTSSATAMALLAFQGAGNTHIKGKFKTNVKKGWEFLIKQQQADGSIFGPDAPPRHLFYTHGQCTIALCELYGMTRDPKFRDPAIKAVEYCVKTQTNFGGWRYHVGDDGKSTDNDTSVTGWLVMALQSARMSKLEVPPATLENIGRYLDRASKNGGSHYGYEAGASDSEVMTAEGLLCRQYLGWRQTDKRLAAGCDSLLSSNLPVWAAEKRNVYYWYYATQVMHHMEGARWEKWNSVMRDLLVSKQVQSGAEKGSWDPHRPHPDAWAEAGRLYVTCLSTYILEVYYRHLPIYAKIGL